MSFALITTRCAISIMISKKDGVSSELVGGAYEAMELDAKGTINQTSYMTEVVKTWFQDLADEKAILFLVLQNALARLDFVELRFSLPFRSTVLNGIVKSRPIAIFKFLLI